MSDMYVGEIRVFGGNFAINEWAFCQGQLQPILIVKHKRN
jgi:microcystin-dependent protein